MLRCIILFCVFQLGFHAVFAQDELDTLEVVKPPGKMKLFIAKQNELGFYLGINYGFHPNSDGYGTNGKVDLGVHYNRLLFGLFYAGYDGDFNRVLIFPTFFTMAYENGGAFFGYRLLGRQRIQLYGNVNFSYGFIEWIPEDDFQETFLRDNLTIIQPELILEYIGINWLRPAARLGYKSVSDFDLPKLNAGDLNGIYLMVGLKIGPFKKQKP